MSNQIYVFDGEQKSVGYELVENGKLGIIGRGHEKMISEEIKSFVRNGYSPIFDVDSMGRTKPLQHKLKFGLINLI
ncbi:MAG: hypothetical protein AABX93_01560 [Nanoarchaeota archaeon]|mgnify:CR=1 FL=1